MVSFKTGDDFTRPFATLNDSVTLFGDVRVSWDTYTAKVKYGTLPEEEHKRISRMVKAILLVKCLDDEYIEPKVKEELSAIVSKYNLNETKQDIVNIANRAYDNLEHTLW